jgi:hypothetical protein
VVFSIVGIGTGLWVFVLVGLLVLLVFGGIGFGVLYWGRQRSNRLIQTLANGVPAEGVVTDIQLDTSVRVNGRSPWRVSYTFTANGLQLAGSQQAWNRDETLQPGTKVYIVYLSQDPGINSVYPPLA